jgi:hypothetical protein
MKDIALLGLSTWLLAGSLDTVGGLTALRGRGDRATASGAIPTPGTGR